MPALVVTMKLIFTLWFLQIGSAIGTSDDSIIPDQDLELPQDTFCFVTFSELVFESKMKEVAPSAQCIGAGKLSDMNMIRQNNSQQDYDEDKYGAVYGAGFIISQSEYTAIIEYAKSRGHSVYISREVVIFTKNRKGKCLTLDLGPNQSSYPFFDNSGNGPTLSDYLQRMAELGVPQENLQQIQNIPTSQGFPRDLNAPTQQYPPSGNSPQIPGGFSTGLPFTPQGMRPNSRGPLQPLQQYPPHGMSGSGPTGRLNPDGTIMPPSLYPDVPEQSPTQYALGSPLYFNPSGQAITESPSQGLINPDGSPVTSPAQQNNFGTTSRPPTGGSHYPNLTMPSSLTYPEVHNLPTDYNPLSYPSDSTQLNYTPFGNQKNPKQTPTTMTPSSTNAGFYPPSGFGNPPTGSLGTYDAPSTPRGSGYISGMPNAPLGSPTPPSPNLYDHSSYPESSTHPNYTPTPPGTQQNSNQTPSAPLLFDSGYPQNASNLGSPLGNNSPTGLTQPPNWSSPSTLSLPGNKNSPQPSVMSPTLVSQYPKSGSNLSGLPPLGSEGSVPYLNDHPTYQQGLNQPMVPSSSASEYPLVSPQMGNSPTTVPYLNYHPTYQQGLNQPVVPSASASKYPSVSPQLGNSPTSVPYLYDHPIYQQGLNQPVVPSSSASKYPSVSPQLGNSPTTVPYLYDHPTYQQDLNQPVVPSSSASKYPSVSPQLGNSPTSVPYLNDHPTYQQGLNQPVVPSSSASKYPLVSPQIGNSPTSVPYLNDHPTYQQSLNQPMVPSSITPQISNSPTPTGLHSNTPTYLSGTTGPQFHVDVPDSLSLPGELNYGNASPIGTGPTSPSMAPTGISNSNSPASTFTGTGSKPGVGSSPLLFAPSGGQSRPEGSSSPLLYSPSGNQVQSPTMDQLSSPSGILSTPRGNNGPSFSFQGSPTTSFPPTQPQYPQNSSSNVTPGGLANQLPLVSNSPAISNPNGNYYIDDIRALPPVTLTPRSTTFINPTQEHVDNLQLLPGGTPKQPPCNTSQLPPQVYQADSETPNQVNNIPGFSVASHSPQFESIVNQRHDSTFIPPEVYGHVGASSSSSAGGNTDQQSLELRDLLQPMLPLGDYENPTVRSASYTQDNDMDASVAVFQSHTSSQSQSQQEFHHIDNGENEMTVQRSNKESSHQSGSLMYQSSIDLDN